MVLVAQAQEGEAFQGVGCNPGVRWQVEDHSCEGVVSALHVPEFCRGDQCIEVTIPNYRTVGLCALVDPDCEHLAMPLDANGDGPCELSEVVSWTCWCPWPDCDLVCVKCGNYKHEGECSE